MYSWSHPHAGGEDFLSHEFGCIEVWLRAVDRGGCCRRVKLVAAFTKKFFAQGNLGAAAGAFHLHLGTAFFAKLHPFTIINLAFWALHGGCPPTNKKQV